MALRWACLSLAAERTEGMWVEGRRRASGVAGASVAERADRARVGRGQARP